MAGLVLATACKREPERRAKPRAERICPPCAERGGAALDRADVEVRFTASTKTLYKGLHQSLWTSEVLPKLIAALNRHYAWPTRVVVEFRDCGEVNAFYEPEGPKVIICHDLIDHLVDVFDPHIQDQRVADKMAVGVTAFIMLHEVGHALVDAHLIPITGREEDAVDQLATWLLVTHAEEGEDLALDAASWFALASGEDSMEGMLWDEHSLDSQRFYNIACWVYGANPWRHIYLVEGG
ncbi:MAG: DUF4344 domain-containing metallopeptidase, partial [Deltaproteobacteria bacterium]|nr:DUF4344 domain-containing metallopeptidase [Deltaproteobacteria bacterium]